MCRPGARMFSGCQEEAGGRQESDRLLHLSHLPVICACVQQCVTVTSVRCAVDMKQTQKRLESEGIKMESFGLAVHILMLYSFFADSVRLGLIEVLSVLFKFFGKITLQKLKEPILCFWVHFKFSVL